MLVVPAYFDKAGSRTGAAVVAPDADTTAHIPFDRRVQQDDDDDEPSQVIDDVMRRSSIAISPTHSHHINGNHAGHTHGDHHGATDNDILDVNWKNGYLERKSQVLKKWERRFYILRERFIFSFKRIPSATEDMFAHPYNVILLEGCSVQPSPSRHHPYGFSITHAKYISPH
jgi:hypothetical protein